MLCKTALPNCLLLNLFLLTLKLTTSISTGIAVRFWQLGIEMRPILAKESLWVYPLFAGVGGSFGYWLQGVESRQLKMLTQRREAILEKRRRRDQREEKTEGGVLAAAS
jgi:hypothetical protein